MNQETTYYANDQAGILITSQRMVFPGASYNPRDVSDAAMLPVRPNQGRVLALVATGILFLFFGASLGAAGAVLGFGLITVGMVVRLTARRQYAVRLVVEGQHVNAYAARDMEYVSNIVGAVNQAIRAAGGWRPPRGDEMERP